MTLILDNWPAGVGEHQLRTMFAEFGGLNSIQFRRPLEGVIIELADPQAGRRAIRSLRGVTVSGFGYGIRGLNVRELGTNDLVRRSS